MIASQIKSATSFALAAATLALAASAFAADAPKGSAGKAIAAMDGRFSIGIEDIRKIAIPVLRHRLSTNFQAQAEGLTPETVIQRLIAEIPEPKIAKYE